MIYAGINSRRAGRHHHALIEQAVARHNIPRPTRRPRKGKSSMPRAAKDWGAVNEIVPADKLLARAREIAEGLAKLPALTTKYTRIAITQKLRRIIDEGVTLGLALEGISAADVARGTPK